MRTLVCAAIAVVICAGSTTVLAEDAKPSRLDNLIRRELKVGDPADPNQVAKARSAKRCSQATDCVPQGAAPTVRPQIKPLLQSSPSY